MKWNEHFERVVVLNLPNRRLRRVRLEEHLCSLHADENITWVRAHYGKLLQAPRWWTAGPGAWGCLLSHAAVIADAIRDKITSLLILEDDVVFQPNLHDLLPLFLQQVPHDWGQIYLGGQHIKEPVALADKPFVLRGRNVNRTHAYAVHTRAIAAIHCHIMDATGYIEHPEGWHIDHRLGTAHEAAEWPVYTPGLWIAGQEEEWSNISGNRNPRFWWHPRVWSRKLPFVWVGQNDAEAAMTERQWLHFGNNLKINTLEDVGLDAVVRGSQRLLDWLVMIAEEALDQEKLPALQHAAIPMEKIDAVWQAGSIRWASGMGETAQRNSYRIIFQEAYEQASNCDSSSQSLVSSATA